MLTADRVEVIPVPGIVGKALRYLDLNTTLSVTALPSHGIAATVQTTVDLANAGFSAIPHLSAAQITNTRHLIDILEELSNAGTSSLFVVGGDEATADAPFPDGGALLRAIREHGGDRFTLGVAAYPEGHPHFDVTRGLEILNAKSEHADYAVTQMCFDGQLLGSFIRRAASQGIHLPLWLGVPGRVGARRLADIALRIGVGPSLALATKGANPRLLTRFDSADLRRDALASLGHDASVEGFHVYSFNALDLLSMSGARP